MTDRSLPPLLVCLTLLAACGGACGGKGSEEAVPPPPEERTVRVRVLTVAPEAVTDYLNLPADLLPDRRAVLAAEVPGTVDTLRVQDGQRVAAGELLAAVDTRALRQEAAEAEALFEQAADEHRRAEALFEKRSVTRSALVEAKTARDVAEARLASVRLRLEKSRVEAPWPGTVAARRVEVGDYVAPGQAMFELVDARRLKVRAPVPATDVPFVEVGEPVEIEVSSLPGELFQGRVARLAAELDPGARTLDLEAELDNPDGLLKPGMLARLRIPRQVFTEALLVPLDAVVDLEETRAVYVVAGGAGSADLRAPLRAERREVTLGPTLGERVVVESGLAPGDRVIVEGQSRVAPGQRVEIAP
jgi:membrane fusion protein (multidrug efflux system)